MAANGGSSHIAGSLGYMEETMEVDVKKKFNCVYGCDIGEVHQWNLNELAWHIFVEGADIEESTYSEVYESLKDKMTAKELDALAHIVVKMKFEFLDAAQAIYKNKRMSRRSLKKWEYEPDLFRIKMYENSLKRGEI